MVQYPSFQPSQIICLDYETRHLYAELIQVIELRQMYWVRPLALIVSEESDPGIQFNEEQVIFDLRRGVDLLCPRSLFRVALDTEVIPLLVRLNNLKQSQEGDRHSHQQLQKFIQEIWNAYPDVFEPQLKSP
ncbi:MAG: hypothetical protein ACFE0J_25395 [Elainellaceae cyanobacterium]